jgi:acetate kinase
LVLKILVINAGSSSLKYQFIDMDNLSVIAKGLCERIGIEGSRIKHSPAGGSTVIIQKPMESHTDAIGMVIDALTHPDHGVITDMKDIFAVGHRVVHGGEFFAESVLIDENVKKTIEECIPLAPGGFTALVSVGVLIAVMISKHAVKKRRRGE